MDSYVVEWNVQLTDDEIKALRAGASPLIVRPEHIVRYYKCLDGFFRNSTVEGNSQAIYVKSLPD